MGRSEKVYKCKNCKVESIEDIKRYPKIVNKTLGEALTFTHEGCGCNAKCPKCGGKSSRNLIRVS